MSAEFEIISMIPTRKEPLIAKDKPYESLYLLITDRLKVPGGWIVRSFVKDGNTFMTQTFVPDAGQDWKIT